MDIMYLSQLSRLAYKRDIRIVEELFKENYNTEDIKVINISNLKCFIAIRDDKTYISFRGSDNLKNWLNNFNIGKGIVAQGNIHNGFLMASKTLYNEILPFIKQKRHNRIYLTGHSLGASLASLVSNYLYEDFYDVREVLLIECPNISDKRYIKNTENYKINRVMIKNNIDIVTYMPPFWMDYRNYKCDMIYFNRDGDLVENPSYFTVKLDKIATYLNPFNWTEVAEDHLLDNVMALIEKNKQAVIDFGERCTSNG